LIVELDGIVGPNTHFRGDFKLAVIDTKEAQSAMALGLKRIDNGLFVPL